MNPLTPAFPALPGWRLLRPPSRFLIALVTAFLAALAWTGQAASFTGANVDAFANSYNGRSVDFDGLYGAQCFDLFNFYNRDVVGGPPITGAFYAKEIWTTPSTSTSYVKRSASLSPGKGDVAVFDGTLGGGAGHVAIVLDDQGSNLRVVHQNWTPFVTTIAIVPKVHILGYLRPKNLSVRAIPVSHLDSVSAPAPGKVAVRGWTYDPDSPTASRNVHVYVGGRAGTSGAQGTSIRADKLRGDVGAAFPGIGNYHGFDGSIVTGKRGAQEVCVYAINDDSGGNPLIGCRTVTIADPNPVGYFDTAASPAAGKVRVRGWVFDPNAPGATGTVHVYVGGTAGASGAEGHSVKADASRPDVDAVHHTGKNHGVDVTFATAKRGAQKVCMYGIDTASPGENVFFGCKSITVETPTSSTPVGSAPGVSPSAPSASNATDVPSGPSPRGGNPTATPRRPRVGVVRRGTPRADALVGGRFNDRLLGLAGPDRLFGYAGNDVLDAGAGNDRLDGGPGNDVLDGSSGHDRLIGGSGKDRLLGGPGNDVFLARDGVRDMIVCGPGKDRVFADRFDSVLGCEVVRRS
ncbi:MAG: CHAP domain-containing protein [Dehalococcoidia bacterium]|nr:CHAP domain-containing protein [Dehalococcoidia bacterium]